MPDHTPEARGPRSEEARLFAWGLALHFAFWLALTLSVDPQELGIGAAVVLVAELFVLRATWAYEGARPRGLGYGWARDLPSPMRVLRESAVVMAAAWGAARLEPSAGRLSETKGPSPSTPGRIAMATIGQSMAPKGIVVEVLSDGSRFLLHELVPTRRARPEGAPETKP